MRGTPLVAAAILFAAGPDRPNAMDALSSRALSPAPYAPSSIPGRWELVFSDEFEGPALDKEKWVTCYWWDQQGCTNLGNKEMQWYQPENVIVADGHAYLRAQHSRPEASYSEQFPFTSGLISTGRDTHDKTATPRFDFQYGFAEIRARIPSGRGLHPAFWMLPSSHNEKPEIDVMEVIGQEPDFLYTFLHYFDESGVKRHVGGPTQTYDLSTDWNIFAVEWQPNRIVWYLNGDEIFRNDVQSGIPHERMYILINLAVGGNWPGPPSEETQFPSDLILDYVRVWQLSD